MPNQNMPNQNNSNISIITYKLPDGEAHVPTWEYILSEIEPTITNITSSINAQNVALTRINARIQEWLDEQTPNT